MRKGQKCSQETKERMSARQRGKLNCNWGRTTPVETRAKMSAASLGELGPNWQGADIGYRAAHYRARGALIGHSCAHADGSCSGSPEAAFNHDTPPEFVKVDERGLLFSARFGDYIPLCQAHHGRYDKDCREKE